MDPRVERVILRCLESDPQNRSAVSALAVAAALPGGDPLGEALAAGGDAIAGNGRGGAEREKDSPGESRFRCSLRSSPD